MARDTDIRKSYYAFYTEDGVALTIKIGSEEYFGVILDDGSKIAIGKDMFEIIEPNDLKNKTLEAFD